MIARWALSYERSTAKKVALMGHWPDTPAPCIVLRLDLEMAQPFRSGSLPPAAPADVCYRAYASRPLTCRAPTPQPCLNFEKWDADGVTVSASSPVTFASVELARTFMHCVRKAQRLFR